MRYHRVRGGYSPLSPSPSPSSPSPPLHWQMVLKIRLLEEEPLHWPDCSMVTYCLKPCGAAAAGPAASAASECEAARLRRRWRRRASLWWNRRRASSFIERRRVVGTSCSRSSVVAIVRRRRPHRLHEARSLLYLSVPADERESPWVKGRAARVNRNALNARIGDPIPRLGLD